MMADVIGFIGLGAIGGPMASNLARKGFDVLAYDLSEAAMGLLVEEGARAAPSAAAVAAVSDVIFLMLPNSYHVRSVVEQDLLPNLKPGAIIVDSSTIAPDITDAVAAATTVAGHVFVDAPVGRTVLHAKRGECLFMVGADDEHFQRILPMLNAMGTTVVQCGKTGSGIRVKIVNNLLSIAVCQATSEALTLGAAFGLDLQVELDVMRSTTANNGFLQFAFPDKTLSGDIEPGFQVDLAHKDVSIAIDAANRLRVPMTVAAAAREAISIARARGYGGKDWTAILDSWMDLSGIDKPLLKN